MKLAILGAGSWGSALAIALASKFDALAVWSHNADRAKQFQKSRENTAYLPGFQIASNVAVTPDLAEALHNAELILSVVPCQHTREVWTSAEPFLPAAAIVVSASKGIERDSLLRPSQIIMSAIGRPVCALSGPTFAREVAAGEPAAIVVAGQKSDAETVQKALATSSLRFYASCDLVGVELGAALKNVIAIGAGIGKGLGLGSNSVAALITRGIAEISRLAVKMGGEPRTLAGLAGLGDLVLTATGDLSRNRAVGIELGRGRTLPEILSNMNMVAEGVSTCAAAADLARREQVEMPIVEKMYDILYNNKPPKQAIRELMERPLTFE